MDFKVSKRNSTLRGQIEDKIRAAICEGYFVPGQRLVERELCELLDVSRTSVREALRHFEAEGLISFIPHKGPTVTIMNKAEARQLYELRALLEGYAGEQFALFGPEDLKVSLSAAVSNFERIAMSGTSGELLAAKAGFYDLLLKGCGNVFLGQSLESLYNRIAILRMTSMSQPGRLEHSLAELREIVAAIQAGDGTSAGNACRRHIHNAAMAALSGMSSSAVVKDQDNRTPSCKSES